MSPMGWEATHNDVQSGEMCMLSELMMYLLLLLPLLTSWMIIMQSLKLSTIVVHDCCKIAGAACIPESWMSLQASSTGVHSDCSSTSIDFQVAGVQQTHKVG